MYKHVIKWGNGDARPRIFNNYNGNICLYRSLQYDLGALNISSLHMLTMRG